MIIQTFGTPNLKSEFLVILDRDGTINIDEGYTFEISQLIYLPTVFETIQLISERGVAIAVASNQSGIGRGYYTENQMHDFHRKIWQDFEVLGVKGLNFFCCPHLPEENCFCRKPKPGLLLKAIDVYSLSKNNALFVGNSDADAQCGRQAGIEVRINTTSTLHSIISDWMNSDCK